MGITSGSPLPDIKTTTTKTQEAPQYYTDYLTGLASAGTTAMGRTPEQMVAGLDPLQMKAYQMTPDVAAAYRPGITAAGQTAAAAAAGVTPERIQSFMNPYTSNVVQEMARLAEQNIQRNILPSLRGGMVGAGQLGSQRYAGALGQGLAEASRTLTGQQYGALSEGYKGALEAALKEMGLETEAAKAQAGIAKTAQELGLAEAKAVGEQGTAMQAYQQALKDAPLKTATQAQALLRGFDVPKGETSTFVGPGQAGQYSVSPLSAVTGIMSMLGATKPGSPLDTAIRRVAGSLFGGGGGGGPISVSQNEYVGTGSSGQPLYFSPERMSYYNAQGQVVPVDYSADYSPEQTSTTDYFSTEG
jgi:uncharacterized protein YbjQ (UPF0145 family)